MILMIMKNLIIVKFMMTIIISTYNVLSASCELKSFIDGCLALWTCGLANITASVALFNLINDYINILAMT